MANKNLDGLPTQSTEGPERRGESESEMTSFRIEMRTAKLFVDGRVGHPEGSLDRVNDDEDKRTIRTMAGEYDVVADIPTKKIIAKGVGDILDKYI